jgi:putative ATP-dependent endonuclease of OLD family
MKHPYLSRIEIRNFRNFHELEIDLDPTAVFVGQNQAGKSNLIEALRLLFDPTLPEAARHLRLEDFWDGLDQPFGGATIEIKAFLRDFDDNAAAKALLADCLVEHDPLTALVTYRFGPRNPEAENPETLGEEDYDFVVFGGVDENNRIGYELRRWLAIVVLPALRDAQGDLQNWRRSPLRPLLERARKNIPVEMVEEVRNDLETAKQSLLRSAPVKELIDDLNDRLKLLAGPVQAVTTEFDFAPSEPQQLFRSLRVFLCGRSTKPIGDASLGTANLLFLALLLQDLEDRQEAQEIVSTIVAIEEPEAHLHPQLQRLLFRYFLGRGHPIFLTTHSPHIASVAPLESIVLLREEGGESTAHSARALNLSERHREDLQRYLDVTRAELYFARGVILVEGIADQYLVNAFATRYIRTKNLGDSLDDFGISVCVVGGTDFKPYWTLLSSDGLAIPRVVITDADPEPSGASGISYRGIARGAALLSDEAAEEIEAASIIDGDEEAIVQLSRHGIFVGNETLELDLIDGLSAEMKAAYGDLRSNTRANERFAEAVDQAGEDEDSAEEVIRRIEAIGKGRYAQRLASRIGNKPAPAYIISAIEHIVSLVQ